MTIIHTRTMYGWRLNAIVPNIIDVNRAYELVEVYLNPDTGSVHGRMVSEKLAFLVGETLTLKQFIDLRNHGKPTETTWEQFIGEKE